MRPRYKIKNIVTNKYLRCGYNRKVSFGTYPRIALQNSHDYNENPGNYVVEKYEMKLIEVISPSLYDK